MSEQRLTTQNIRDLVTEWSVTEVGFDRWLASVKAEAWDEGYTRSARDLSGFESDGSTTPNPYRGGPK